MRTIKIQAKAIVEVVITPNGEKFITIKPLKEKFRSSELTAQDILDEVAYYKNGK